MIPPRWIPYRRPTDDELVGYLVPDGEDMVPVTLFGYPLSGSEERVDAEQRLAVSGLSCLADHWELAQPDGSAIRVKIREITPDRLVVTVDDFGAGGTMNDAVVLEVPETGRLRPVR